MPKVLVIGGAGYIGSHVVKELLEGGYETVVFDDMSTGQEVNLFKEAGFIRGNILDRQALDNAMSQNIDAVVHLAGKKAVGESMENPQKYAENNLNGSINILNSMVDNGVRHIVFSSSAAVYGTPQYLPLDEKHPLNPVNFYGFTKLEVENLLDWYSRLKDFNYIALRYFNASGADESGDIGESHTPETHLIPIVLQAAAGKRPSIKMFGDDYPTPDGTCVRDYIHVNDLADAHILALEKMFKDNVSERFNLGSGSGYSVAELVKKAKEITGIDFKVEVAPRRAGDPAVLVADSAKAQKVLGWKPKYDLTKIIQTAWNWEQHRKF